MDNEYPTVISFFTRTWEYPMYAQKMQTACRRLGLESHIVEKKDSGEWLQNTRIKPTFIYEAIQELKRPVLWIDVDGSILAKPELLKAGYEYDFAAKKMAEHRDRMWHVGTMYFNYTDATLEFLKEWNEKVLDAGGSDELALDLMWRDPESSIHNLRIGELPDPYFEMLRKLTQPPSTGTIVCHRASQSASKMAMKQRNKERLKKSVDKPK